MLPRNRMSQDSPMSFHLRLRYVEGLLIECDATSGVTF